MSDFKIVKLLDPISISLNIRPTGAYNASTTYGIGDSVSYNNSSYVCILPTTGNLPTDTTYWQLLASASTTRLGVTARNQSGSTITKGSVVYFSGASGNLPLLTLAQANSEAASTKTIGLALVDIINNSNGEIIILGTAESLDTSSFVDGDQLWLSAATAGALTTTKPTQPNHAVFIGIVSRAHPTSGTIELNIQNGYEIEELHNVLVTSIANGQVLKYESASSLWKNVTLTKSDVGLSNVDNTSDLNKPISTATQTALNLKYDASNPNSYETTTQLNTRDTNNRNRSNHTGTQTASTISDFNEAAQDTSASMITGATHDGVSVSYNDVGNTLAITNTDKGSSAVATHEAASDPHTQYQKESEKASANGYASLDSSTLVPKSQLGSGTADSTTYLRGDGTWSTISVTGLGEEFETVSKNLKSYPYSLTYTSGVLTSIAYTTGSGTITKTLNYTSGVLTSVVLSGSTPSGIDLTKTLTYSSGVLTSISYS